MSDVMFYRPNASQDLFRVFRSWGGPGFTDYGEFQMVQFTPGGACLQHAKAVNNSIETQLANNVDIWELAVAVGAAGATTEDQYLWLGGGHGNTSRRYEAILVDGVDQTAAVPEITFVGTEIIRIQSFDMLLPTNNAVKVGTYQLRHTFTRDGCRVRIEFAPLFGMIEWYAMLTGMVPLALFNRVQFGSNPVETVTNAGASVTHSEGPQPKIAASSTDHPFTLSMTLPSGSPNINGSWTDSDPTYTYWKDQVAGAKAYCAAIEMDNIQLRKMAVPLVIETMYAIEKTV